MSNVCLGTLCSDPSRLQQSNFDNLNLCHLQVTTNGRAVPDIGHWTLDIGLWTSSLRILRIGSGQLLVILVLRIRGTVVATREARPSMFPQMAVQIVCLDKTAKGFQLRAFARLHGRIELFDVAKVARGKVETHNLKLTVAG